MKIKDFVKKHRFKTLRCMLWKDTPVQVINLGDYHTRIKCKGHTFLADNEELSAQKENYVVATFYKGSLVKVQKDDRFTCHILYNKNLIEINKKDLDFVFCRINTICLKRYVNSFGVCFLPTKEYLEDEK